jgi:hypothetical protein
MKFSCTKYHTPFEEHLLHWWCFFLPKHYTHVRRIVDETGEITDTPIKLRQFLRNILVGGQ